MRLIGILMVFFSCAGGGLYLSGLLSARVRKLTEADRMLTAVIGMICYQNLPTAEIFDRLRAEGCPDGENGVDPIGNFAADPLFRRQERQLLIRSGQLLGTCDRESQTVRLEMERDLLRRMLQEAEQDRDIRGKLFRTMGLLLGALAVILAI
ncbi:MAG: stage III sporulation protein AB [Oscillospiraceae bacterium]|nr:stage III sporulation protein AB [Oscillospiraceae bacterium]